MAIPVINQEIDKLIREYSAEGITTKDIADILKLKYQTVASHMLNNNIPRNHSKRGGRRMKKPVVIIEGFFNEHERENWLM